MLAAAVYTIAQGFPEENANLFHQVLSAISGYSLPFFLYLIMFVVLFDLFLLINLLVKIVSPEKRQNFSFQLYTLSAMIVLSVAVVAGGAINLNTIRVSEYNITVPKGSSNIDNLRVVFVADFHIQQNTSLRYVELYVRKLKALKPDLLLYGGDIVEGDSENETTEFNEILGGEVLDIYMLVILGDHRSTQLQEVSRTATDVQFSGHTHNGQIFPINLVVRNMFELSWEYRKIRSTHFFVTSGLRLWEPPVKIAGKSEIMLVSIVFE
ncbi:MAG: hypothetical protein AB9833_07450 [Bacteroidales bacterium]